MEAIYKLARQYYEHGKERFVVETSISFWFAFARQRRHRVSEMWASRNTTPASVSRLYDMGFARRTCMVIQPSGYRETLAPFRSSCERTRKDDLYRHQIQAPIQKSLSIPQTYNSLKCPKTNLLQFSISIRFPTANPKTVQRILTVILSPPVLLHNIID